MSQPIFYLCPYRFTTNPADMIRFYETLGLVTKVGRDRENFAVLGGSGGRIGVHELDSAHTSTVSTDMCFETPDAETAAIHCRELGLTATVVDEAYGRRVDVGDATHTVTVNEEMRDFYGYTQGRADASPKTDVVAAYFTSDFDTDAHWFANFGFHSDDDNQDWRELRAATSAGIIGLHQINGQEPGSTAIGFASAVPLETMLERLNAAGYTDAAITHEGTTRSEVTDPDGFITEIHPGLK